MGWLLAVSVLVVLGGAVVAGATQQPSHQSAAVAQPAPPPTPPPNPPADDECPPGMICNTTNPPPPVPSTQLPLPTEPPAPLPPCDPSLPAVPCQPTDAPSTTTTTPCTGDDCIPQPVPRPEDGGPPPAGPPDGSENGEAECGLFHLGGCFENAINGFFRGIVTAALNPLLDLLSNSLLTTPTLEDIPQILHLWSNSWHIMLAAYGLLVMIGGIVVMSHESLQTRYSIKEIAPRMVMGFVAGALSLFLATKAINLANALSEAVIGGGLDADSGGTTLKNMVSQSLTGGLWIFLLAIFLLGVIIALLITYVVRVALIVILLAGAPLALMFHATPQTEGIAFWWWRASGALLAIQVLQSLALVTGLRIFLAPGGFDMFGVTRSGLVNILVVLALMFILFRIPSWLLSAVRIGNGRSLLGGVAKAYVAGKAFGAFTGRNRGPGRTTGRSNSGGSTRWWRTSGTAGGGGVDPYAKVRADATGQYALPFTGIRTHPRKAPVTASRVAAAAGKRTGRGGGRQLALPLGREWPENTPVLGRDGQYRLPLDVQRASSTGSEAPSDPALHRTGRRRGAGGRQLELPFDPYRGNRPTRSGQYPLPLSGLHRVRRPTASTAGASTPASPGRPRPQQLRLPFDPYQGNRPTRSGQYRLPFDGLTRTPRGTSGTGSEPAHTPSPAARSRPRGGRQLRLPLDLPTPTTTPPSTPPRTPPARPASRPPSKPTRGGGTS